MQTTARASVLATYLTLSFLGVAIMAEAQPTRRAPRIDALSASASLSKASVATRMEAFNVELPDGEQKCEIFSAYSTTADYLDWYSDLLQFTGYITDRRNKQEAISYIRGRLPTHISDIALKIDRCDALQKSLTSPTIASAAARLKKRLLGAKALLEALRDNEVS